MFDPPPSGTTTRTDLIDRDRGWCLFVAAPEHCCFDFASSIFAGVGSACIALDIPVYLVVTKQAMVI